MSELTKRVKAKYPQYANISDAELEKKVLAKYPSYKSLASKSLGGFASNVLSSTGKVIGDTAKAVLSPVQTAKSIIGLGSGIIQLAIPGEQGNEELARQVGKFYADRYGSLDKAWNSLYNDPAGVAMDVSTVLGIGAGAAKAAGLGKTASGLSKVAKISDPLNVGSKLTNNFKSKINLGQKIKGSVKDFGDTYAIKSTRIPDAKQFKITNKMKGMNTRFGSNIEDLIKNTGLYGQNVDAINDYIKPLEDLRTSKIRGSGLTVQNKDLLKSFGDEIAQLSTPEAMRDPASRALRQKLIDEAGLFAQNQPIRRAKTSLESLDKSRAKIDASTPNAQFESDKSAFQRSLGDVYRGTVNKAAGTGDVGKELSVLYDFKKAIEKAPKGKNTLPMGIIGSIATAGGALSGTNPVSRFVNAGLSYGATKVLNSPKFIGGLSKVAQKVSNAKTPKAFSNIGAIAPKAYEAGKIGRMLATNLGNNQDRFSKQSFQQSTIKPIPYQPNIPPIVPKKQVLTKEIKYNPPKNVFSNKSNFGKSFKLKAGSFN